MAWTNINKPTGANYTNVNAQGKEQYDQGDLTFDDARVFYDGIEINAWTDIPKPAGGYLIVRGMATGLLMPLTYSRQYDASAWQKISKPID